MDTHTFDHWTVALTQRRTRRTAMRLLTAVVLGGIISQRGVASVLAARPDRDNDGLYDDDETDVYGTNPDVYDTDGDGTGDGEEIYNRDNGLGGPSDPLTPDGGTAPPQGGGECPPEGCLGDVITTDEIPAGAATVICAPGLTNCGGYCANIMQDSANCGICGWDCGNRDLNFCYQGFCVSYCETGTRRCTGEVICRSFDEPCP